MKNKRELAKDVVFSLWSSYRENIDLDRFAIDFIKNKNPEIGDLATNDLWEDIRPSVIRILRKKIGDCFSKQISPNYVFSEVSDAKLIRYDIQGQDEEERMRRAQIIFHRNKIIGTLHKVGWRTFEFFCAHLLALYGCNEIYVTQGSKEGGIDFYGTLDLTSQKFLSLFSRVMNGPRIKIIGQAKNWENEVGEGEVNKFVKDHRDFISGKHKLIKKLPESFLKEDAPFYPIFMTTSSFTKDAIKSANRDRIIIKDGEQIVEELIMLSISQNILSWFPMDEHGKIVFNDEEFISWTNTLSNKYNASHIV